MKRSMVRRLSLLGLLLLFFSSCSHLKSGHYILLEEGDSVETLALEFGVSSSAILNANRSQKFMPGEWVFIPLDRGIMPRILGDSALYPSGPLSGEEFFSGKFLWPVPDSHKVSSFYGPRGGRIHHGIDIPAPTGSTFVAAEDGKVIQSGKKVRGYGNLTIISHDGGYFTVYAHASKNYTKLGQKVYRGQIIGEVGNTGRSTGPHLHFEVRMKKRSVDPMAYFQKKGDGEQMTDSAPSGDPGGDQG